MEVYLHLAILFLEKIDHVGRLHFLRLSPQKIPFSFATFFFIYHAIKSYGRFLIFGGGTNVTDGT